MRASSAFPTGPVTLTLATEDTSRLTPALVKGFEKLHPNVTIAVRHELYRLRPKIDLELASSTPLDLSEAVTLETPVKDHLLLDLDPYAAQYGWMRSISPYALAEYRMGSTLVAGSGPLYAVSSGFAPDRDVLQQDADEHRLGIQHRRRPSPTSTPISPRPRRPASSA